jgi:small subunit ribosomal protein S2
MPYVTDRWLGGMLTNFATVRKSIKKMSSIDKMLKDEVIIKTLAKRERLMMTREEEKLKRVLGGITELTRLPAALFVVDVKREHIAVSEAKKLGIPVFAMCDTNSNPDLVDYPIPANDDAYKSISIIITAISKAIEEGLAERKQDKDDAREAEEVEAKKAADDDSQEAAKVAAKYEKEAEQE